MEEQKKLLEEINESLKEVKNQSKKVNRWNLIAPLFGVIIGGLITFLTNYYSQYSETRLERKSKIQNLYKEINYNLHSLADEVANAHTKRITNIFEWGMQYSTDIRRRVKVVVGGNKELEPIYGQIRILQNKVWSDYRDLKNFNDSIDLDSNLRFISTYEIPEIVRLDFIHFDSLLNTTDEQTMLNNIYSKVNNELLPKIDSINLKLRFYFPELKDN